MSDARLEAAMMRKRDAHADNLIATGEAAYTRGFIEGRRQERNRIRAALLSDAAVDSARNAGTRIPINADGDIANIHNGPGALIAAMASIGLTEQEEA